MDINSRLNEIIVKYQRDRCYPRFQKKLLGEAALMDWAEEKEADGERVLCVGADQEDINYFSHLLYGHGKESSYALYFDGKERNSEIYDRIVVISRKPGDKMVDWCRRYEKPVTFIYDYLEMQGVYCEDEIYKVIGADAGSIPENDFPQKKGWREAVLLEFYAQKKKLAFAEDTMHQCHYARKLFFLALYIRNFIQAERYQKMLYGWGDPTAEVVWQEIQALLTEIKQRLHERKMADIVMVWMDAVSYGSGCDMAYLREQIKSGISYENAFTVTPYTNPTAQTLFLGKKLIDDALYLENEITEEGSPVLLDLRSHGYTCKVISGYLSIFERKLRSKAYHALYAPCSEILWDILQELLNADGPAFLLAHALIEGHAPHLTTRMEEEDLWCWPSLLHKGHLELDEQMRYYMGFLGQETVRIFMSDHGQPIVREQFHTYFVVTGKDHPHRAAKELFSYVDFSKLIHGILEGDKLDAPLFDREYAEVQMLDRYNRQIIEDIIQNKRPLSLCEIGYFGIITKDHLYLKYHIGNEFLARRDHMEYEPNLYYQANDVCDVSLLPYFRRIIGDRKVDISENKKFRYTRYLYKVFENFMKKRKKIFDLIDQRLQKYPKKSIALRMGGDHSLELFHILAPESKDRIACIVDRDPACRACRLGLPVLPIEKMGEGEIKAVILSSFDHLEELRKELPSYPAGIDIIDIYKDLEDKGICCDGNFYVVNYMTDEDYDVGFPFDERD